MGEERPERSRFGQRLKRLRELKGRMTQDELARKSGVSVDLVRNYEQGKSFAKEEAVYALADALGVSSAVFQACKLDGVVIPGEKRCIYAAAHVFFHISDSFGVRPCVEDGLIGVSAPAGYVGRALCQWADAVEADASASDGENFGESPVGGLRSEVERRIASSAASHAPVSCEEWLVLNFDEPFDSDECASAESFSERLRWIRVQRGLTQGELAEASGVSVFSLRSYEQGRRSFKDAHRCALANALDVAPEALLEFSLDDPNTASHYLFELAYLLGLKPRRASDGVVLASADAEVPRKTKDAFETFICEWDEAIGSHGTSDPDTYRWWKLQYGLDGSGA